MRSLLPFLTFIAIFAGLVLAIHAYVIHGLVDAPQWRHPGAELASRLIWAMGAMMVFNMFSDRRLPYPAKALVAWPSFVWMATAFYLLLALAASDIAMWLLDVGGVEMHRTRALAVITVTALCVAFGLHGGLRRPAVKRVEIKLGRWPAALDGYRIVQISDVHIGTLIRKPFAQYLTDTINALEPDLTVVTGDLVDGTVDRLRDEVAPFGELRARDGVYFVTGNHDHYSGARDWVHALTDLGMRVLRNTHEVIERGEASFTLAGVDDHTSGRRNGGGEDVPAALSGTDPARPVVLLAHNPQSLVAASKHGVDLQLSGHTHGGQMWPFRHAVKLQTLWIAGLYRFRGSLIYVSRGTGFWGPPIRLGEPAEITELVLRSPAGGDESAQSGV